MEQASVSRVNDPLRNSQFSQFRSPLEILPIGCPVLVSAVAQ
jgi:hypothetical protein